MPHMLGHFLGSGNLNMYLKLDKVTFEAIKIYIICSSATIFHTFIAIYSQISYFAQRNILLSTSIRPVRQGTHVNIVMHSPCALTVTRP